MAYTPTEWATGDVITAQKLNKMEQGIAGAGLQLYGPYVAYHNITESVGSKQTKFITCENLEDINSNTITYPDVTNACIILPVQTDSGSLPMAGFAAPSINANGGRGNEWTDGSIVAYNPNSEASSVASCSITFYSTVEFPQES